MDKIENLITEFRNMDVFPIIEYDVFNEIDEDSDVIYYNIEIDVPNGYLWCRCHESDGIIKVELDSNFTLDEHLQIINDKCSNDILENTDWYIC